ncbi:MAG: hypothetical protein JNM56_19625 [Planctomycetia bacterium]|nr:hypothetical protein [Planctomycetia bacterium]
MSAARKGIRLPLSPARQLVVELLHHARRVPSLPLSKQVSVAALAEVRAQAESRPSWTAIFMKAYGIVARRYPPLRQTYIAWPWPHLYQHPYSECAVLIERELRGEPVVLGAKVRAPEEATLTALDGHLRRYREAPIESIGYFRQVLRVGALPAPLRRAVFWYSLHLSGAKRAKHWGTFMLSSLGVLGVEQHHPLTPLTTYFTFGPIDAQGNVTLKIVYDHRVMDGRTVARCLNELDAILHGEVLEELQCLAGAVGYGAHDDAVTLARLKAS